MIDYDKLRKDLEFEEGVVDEFYFDSDGNLTCGIGHLVVVGGPINQIIREEFFKMDVKERDIEFSKLSQLYRDTLDTEPRVRVIYNMLFNLGLKKLLKFKKMWKALLNHDYNEAGNQILDSDAGRKLKNRYTRLADIMRRGY